MLKSFSVGFLGSFPHLQQTNRIVVPVRVVRGLGSLGKGARGMLAAFGSYLASASQIKSKFIVGEETK